MNKKILVFVTLLLTGCNFEPRYAPPCVDTPDSWRTPSDPITTCANVEWWQELGDPILDALILEALKNNNDLLVAAWRVYDFYSQFIVAFSPFYPQIEAAGGAARTRFPQQTSFIPNSLAPIQSLYNFMFNLDWVIDIWGEIRSQAHAAFALWMEAEENRRKVVLTLISAVAQSYVTLRQLDQELEISRMTLRDRQEYLRLAKLRFEGGLTSEIEVMQALSVLQQVEAAIAVLEGSIPVQENLLSLLLGTHSQSILRGKGIDQFHLPCVIPAGLPSELLCRRPDILAAENRLIAANANIGAARAAFFPQISLTSFFGGASFDFNTLFQKPSQTWGIGGQYLLPIFTGGRLLGQLHLAKAEKEEMVYSYKETVLNAFKEVNDALVLHQQAKEVEKAEAIRVGATKEYLHLAWLRYYNGQTDYLTVLDAEQQYYNSEIQWTKAKGNILITLVDVYRSLGGGWVTQADACLRSCAEGA